MASKTAELTALKVKATKEPGYYGDGKGLYLQVSRGGAKSWIFRYKLGDRRREMGLGSASVWSLAEARARAADANKLVAQGIDPIEAKKAGEVAAKLEAATAMTFRACAQAFIDAHRAGWKNAKHGDQWGATLATYAYPLIGDLPTAAVDTDLVMQILDPIWSSKVETASRVRGRIESILDWAAVRGYRAGENPARWRGHLQSLLPAKSKVARIEHHAALPYADMADFFLTLQAQDGTSARALEFAILTAARTGEVLGATWSEIDLTQRVWAITGDRMKGGREHRVPLSDAALVVLRKQNAVRRGSFVFPGQRARKPEATPDLTKRAEGRPLSSMALLMVLRRMKRGDLTAHGFRSTFRDWVAEQTNFPHEVAEMALAHAVGDKVEAAYRRGDLFEKRRELADAWGQYCTRVPTGMRAEGAVEATSTDVVLPWSGKQAAGSRPATAA